MLELLLAPALLQFGAKIGSTGHIRWRDSIPWEIYVVQRHKGAWEIPVRLIPDVLCACPGKAEVVLNLAVGSWTGKATTRLIPNDVFLHYLFNVWGNGKQATRYIEVFEPLYEVSLEAVHPKDVPWPEIGFTGVGFFYFGGYGVSVEVASYRDLPRSMEGVAPHTYRSVVHHASKHVALSRIKGLGLNGYFFVKGVRSSDPPYKLHAEAITYLTWPTNS